MEIRQGFIRRRSRYRKRYVFSSFYIKFQKVVNITLWDGKPFEFMLHDISYASVNFNSLHQLLLG